MVSSNHEIFLTMKISRSTVSKVQWGYQITITTELVEIQCKDSNREH